MERPPGRRQPGGSEVVTGEALDHASVAAPDRVRARWRADRRRYRRRVSLALDLLCIRLYGADAAAQHGIRDRWGYDDPGAA
ncbi:hypothetical protein RB614_19740 [Phytohabitans sp. ZYX-F-186]|uniref:Uncharacterized protein n=1 Tax=Phytohabitans maris TaxID=3071409 RepID=A0ABU0ZK51_9ACTN|nr:hypothetical protein [Phytohabitans sp. ZYX-F-186]MDQ7906752.1 hypothetical protein [Phytohabitans sp. ZYX-F-186]